MNPMRKIMIDKIVLNCGAVEKKLERSIKLLQYVTGATPKKTLAKKRIPAFDIRPGLEIGCKVTIRGKKAVELLKKLLTEELEEKQFGPGFANFPVHEYIQIPSLKYQSEIGIMGFDVCVSLKRAGFSICKRKRKKSKIPARHRISKEETIQFMKENFDIKILTKGEEI